MKKKSTKMGFRSARRKMASRLYEEPTRKSKPKKKTKSAKPKKTRRSPKRGLLAQYEAIGRQIKELAKKAARALERAKAEKNRDLKGFFESDAKVYRALARAKHAKQKAIAARLQK